MTRLGSSLGQGIGASGILIFSLPSILGLIFSNPAVGKMIPFLSIRIALIIPSIPLAPSKCLYKRIRQDQKGRAGGVFDRR